MLRAGSCRALRIHVSTAACGAVNSPPWRADESPDESVNRI
jgi:hypothetical protein